MRMNNRFTEEYISIFFFSAGAGIMKLASLLPATTRVLRAPEYRVDGSMSLKGDMVINARDQQRRRAPLRQLQVPVSLEGKKSLAASFCPVLDLCQGGPLLIPA